MCAALAAVCTMVRANHSKKCVPALLASLTRCRVHVQREPFVAIRIREDRPRIPWVDRIGASPAPVRYIGGGSGSGGRDGGGRGDPPVCAGGGALGFFFLLCVVYISPHSIPARAT